MLPRNIKQSENQMILDWLIEQGLTSHQTHYRSYRGWFLQVIWPKQQCQSTEDDPRRRTVDRDALAGKVVRDLDASTTFKNPKVLWSRCDLDLWLLSSKSNQFIFAPDCIQVVDLVRFPQAVCMISCLQTFSIFSRTNGQRENGMHSAAIRRQRHINSWIRITPKSIRLFSSKSRPTPKKIANIHLQPFQ